jgi:hypothetical protein
MAASTNQAIGRIANQTKTSEGTQVAQSSFINELPGAMFAALTLFYVVSSLVHLI